MTQPAGEGCGPNSSLPQASSAGQTGVRRRGLNERQVGLYPLPMEGPLVSDDVLMQVRGAQRRRLISSVRETMWSLNWIHGEFSRPAAGTQANSIGASKRSHLHGEALRRCSELRVVDQWLRELARELSATVAQAAFGLSIVRC